MDAGFLARAECYFGGGTMLAMTLGEYRESRDIDFLCSSREGFRSLRETVTDRFQACNDVVGRNIRKLALTRTCCRQAVPSTNRARSSRCRYRKLPRNHRHVRIGIHRDAGAADDRRLAGHSRFSAPRGISRACHQDRILRGHLANAFGRVGRLPGRRLAAAKFAVVRPLAGGTSTRSPHRWW